jgi:hypothetical protein
VDRSVVDHSLGCSIGCSIFSSGRLPPIRRVSAALRAPFEPEQGSGRHCSSALQSRQREWLAGRQDLNALRVFDRVGQ